MAVEKFSVSFEPDLGEAIREAADGDDETVSAWLAEAARRRLRSAALRHAVDTLIAEAGLTEEELEQAGAEAEAEAIWTQPSARRSPTH